MCVHIDLWGHNAKWVCTRLSWRKWTGSMQGIGSGYALPASQHWLTLRHRADNHPVQTKESFCPVWLKRSGGATYKNQDLNLLFFYKIFGNPLGKTIWNFPVSWNRLRFPTYWIAVNIVFTPISQKFKAPCSRVLTNYNGFTLYPIQQLCGCQGLLRLKRLWRCSLRSSRSAPCVQWQG